MGEIQRNQFIQKSLEESRTHLQVGEARSELRSEVARDEEIFEQLIADIGVLLQKLDKGDPRRTKILEHIKAYRNELSTVRKKREGIETPVGRMREAQTTLQQLDREPISSTDRDAFLATFALLPKKMQIRYLERLRHVFKSRNEASVVSALRAALFEMTRITIVFTQGLETATPPEKEERIHLTYKGYAPEETTFDAPPTREIRGYLEPDVPMIRDGRPYMYETKSYPRKLYGADAQTRNQILKYESAIVQGRIAGATVELRGRMDPAFLAWAVGQRIDDPGVVPNVEILYTCELPSGKEYRFVLKRARQGGGLRFQNDADYSDDDLEMIRGIQRSLSDKSIVSLISDPHVDPMAASDELKPHLAQPGDIPTVALAEEFEQLRRAAIFEKLHAKTKEALINRKNEKNVLSEYATPAYVEETIRRFLDYLAQNPKVAEVKRHYIIAPEIIPVAVERTMASIQRIATYERERLRDPKESKRQDERLRFGYRGKREGVALDIEHIITDVLYNLNKESIEWSRIEKAVKHQKPAVQEQQCAAFFKKVGEDRFESIFKSEEELRAAVAQDQSLRQLFEKSLTPKQRVELLKIVEEAKFVRAYNWPERFMTLRVLMESLASQDRRYQELRIFDPKTGKLEYQRGTNDEDIEKTKNTLVIENVRRVKEHIEALRHKPKEERRGEKMAHQHTRQLHAIEREMEALSTTQKEEISACENRAREEAKKGDKKVAFGKVKELSLRHQKDRMRLYEQLLSLYQKIIPEQEWRGLTKRIDSIVDQNIMKFIYAVTSEGDVVVQEEALRADVSGRAAHSELAQGRNVYGSGEFAFEKREGKWVLTEINNGSGHYRPDAVSTLPYVSSILERHGLDVKYAELTDSILRGMPLREATLL